MNILSIGNSFSQDAQRYLHQIARAGGQDVLCMNLYIGGCSLERHVENIRADARAYDMQLNGFASGIHVSVKEALESREWDVITLQQVSHKSIDYTTFQPYLSELSAYVKKYAPNARQVLQETWAYEGGSQRLTEELGYTAWEDMYTDVEKAYRQASVDLGGIPIIPAGKAFYNALKSGLPSVHRDTFHAKLGVGRYILGLVWYKTLCGGDILSNPFCDFDEPVSPEEIAIAKKSADSAQI